MTILEKIEARMMSGEPFTYHELSKLNMGPSPRTGQIINDFDDLADRTIRKWRRAGKISSTRVGRQDFWTLVENQGALA